MATSKVFDTEDERRISRTLAIREQIVDSLYTGGLIPDDTSSRVVLMEALNGIDRTVLAKTRIKADDAANQNQAATQQMIAQILKDSRKSSSTIPTQVINPILGAEFDNVDTVPGELDQESTPMTYDTFFKD